MAGEEVKLTAQDIVDDIIESTLITANRYGYMPTIPYECSDEEFDGHVQIIKDEMPMYMVRAKIEKLLAVVWAAEDVIKHAEFEEGADEAWANNLEWALRELEKE